MNVRPSPTADSAIAIAATFTAEPLRESLQYWLNRLNLPAKLDFAPYNQVLQALVDPRSLFALNQNGLNVVLVRFEDWEHAETQNRDLIGALKTAAFTGSSPILVCVCPRSSEWERQLSMGIAGLPAIHLLSSARLLELYPAANSCDPVADKLGHVPYTEGAYAALGTAIVRVFHASRRAPYKVVVLDCDNTLWRGVCGEQGLGGIEIDPASRALQNFMKARQDDGMLLCVCSKNAAEDVEQVFEERPEMPLKRSDFAGWRVNWRSKSENIKSLATELSLGLDSFIFVDDNPMEAAELEAHCPGVLALTLPADPALIPRFLDHVWAFDQYGITAEDRRRTAMYRENAWRERLLAGSRSYADFIAGLELEVEIRPLDGDGEIARASEMTQRTNQFNLTTQRFSEPEIRQALRDGARRILTALVRDRFGDYGQVGLAMFEIDGQAVRVHNLLLSCRVLGKGVEHAMVARLGQIAHAASLSVVEIPYIPTSKNIPARDFLGSFAARYREGRGQGFLYRLPAEVAAAFQFTVPDDDPRAVAPVSLEAPAASHPALDYAWIATHLCDAASILEAVKAAQGIREAAPGAMQARDEMESRLTRIWESVLRISRIGVHDNFFDLGGDSLSAVRILSDLEAATKRSLPLVALIEAPTIAQLAERLRGEYSKPRWSCLVPIKCSGVRAPFYCVHGVGGNVLEFVHLGRLLCADQPFIGIQAMGLNGPAPQGNLSVQEMAACYIREMLEFQPDGPYYMGGSSLGGLVAYEMARQLTAANRLVGLVAMFDTSVPGSGNPRGTQNLRYRVSLHWRNILILDPEERIAYIRARARRGKVRPPEKIRSVNEAVRRAAEAYIPGEYSGRITLFRATVQPPWIVSGPALGWENLVKGGIEIYDTPGHHADLVRDPRVRVLACQLEDALAKAQARFERSAPARSCRIPLQQ